MRRGPSWFNLGSIALAIAFLYVPILILIIYSFNSSELLAVWAGWSARWYYDLLGNDEIWTAAAGSLRIAAVSASAAVLLGTLAAVVLVRIGRFRGRMLFTGLVYAPLVIPDVIIGLAMLLLFVALGLPRSAWTIAIGHTTLTMCFATIIIQSRLLSFDKSLEEVALNLGCPPVKTFLVVTLPLIWPAVASAWALAFTLSLDDVVIASFTNGVGTTTLPIYIFAHVGKGGVSPLINALSTVMMGLMTVAMVLVWRLGGHSHFQHALAVE